MSPLHVALLLLAAAGDPAPDPTVPALETTIVVTARRAPEPLAATAGAISAIDPAADAPAARDVREALALVPGLDVQLAGGSWAEPFVNARGFTGAGENEYVLALVDGVPINESGSGRVDWREIALADVERIEVLRGAAGALYGDNAVGGVVQVLTRRPRGPFATGRATLGSAGQRELGLATGTARDGRWIRLSGSTAHGDGTRARSRWSDRGLHLAGGGAGDRWTWNGAAWTRGARRELPGPLPLRVFERDPDAALVPFDEAHRRRTGARVGLEGRFGKLRLDVAGWMRREDDTVVETLLVETRARDFRGSAAGLSVLVRGGDEGAGPRWLAGLDARHGTFRSRYAEVDGAGATGAPLADGRGRRRAAGLFAELELRPARRTRIVAGLRRDVLRDRFDEDLASDVPDLERARHGAWSPHLALLREVTGGALWIEAAGSFKAPTPMQLFDQRRPFGHRLTWSGLRPQRARSVEAGWRRATGPWAWDVALYAMDVRDEIGFDAAAFRLANIGRSRHAGLEIAVRGQPARGLTLETALSLDRSRVRSGEHAGRRLDNVPRTVGALAARWQRGAWTLGAQGRVVRGGRLDVEGSVPLDGARTLDLFVQRRAGRFDLRLAAQNALDDRYFTWGYVSPLDGTPLVFPGPGRTFTLTVAY